MDIWINAVKRRGKVIDLSELEIDEDIFWIVKSREPRYERFYEWALVIKKEDMEKFWEWMPIRMLHHVHELRIYYVNVWKSSEDFHKFTYVRVFDRGPVEVNTLPDTDRWWIIKQIDVSDDL